MQLKTSYYNSGTGAHSALAIESEFLSFAPTHQFTVPATCVIELADPTGLIMQKYDVALNSVYVGSGRVIIQDPTPDPDDDVSNLIFDGRILKAKHDSTNHRVILLCQDWMHQLSEDRLSSYEMREDLDGIGLRQSEIHADVRGDKQPVYTSGTDYYLYDDDMRWANDEWNGKHLVFPNEMAGSIKVSTGPYDETVSPAIYKDEPEDGEMNVWDDDENKHYMRDSSSGWTVIYDFRVYVNQSHFFQSISTVSIILVADLWSDDDGGTVAVEIWDYTNSAYIKIGDFGCVNYEETNIRSWTFPTPNINVGDVLSSAGLAKVKFTVTRSSVRTDFFVHRLRLECDVVTTGYASAIDIEDTLASNVVLYGAVAYELGGAPDETDETVEAQNPDANDMTLMPAAGATVGDAYYFGFNEKIDGLALNIGTDADGIYTITWKYSKGSDVWEDLSGVQDLTFGFLAPGTNTVKWTIPEDWAVDDILTITGLYWVKAELTALTWMDPRPIGTQAWMLRRNRIRVGTDLTFANPATGLWECAPYCIVAPINTHINALVTGAKMVSADSTLTTDVEATSGITTRHYIERNRQEILRDLGKMDKAACWIPLGTRQLKWKNVTDTSFTAITDADVLAWSGGEYSYPEMKNEYHVYGIRIGDNQLFVDTSNLTPDPGADSKTKYGAYRSDAIMSSGTTSEFETTEMGKSLVGRNMGVPLFLSATLQGLSSYRLGDWLRITSTYLGLTDADYVITHWAYNSKTWRTSIQLQPRTTLGYVDHILYGEHVRRISEQGKETELDSYLAGLRTQTW